MAQREARSLTVAFIGLAEALAEVTVPVRTALMARAARSWRSAFDDSARVRALEPGPLNLTEGIGVWRVLRDFPRPGM